MSNYTEVDIPDARYEHDCSHCVYLGHNGQFDVWYCAPSDDPASGSVINRSSSEGSDYGSFPLSVARSFVEQPNIFGSIHYRIQMQIQIDKWKRSIMLVDDYLNGR